jgi:hypothetical protein
MRKHLNSGDRLGGGDWRSSATLVATVLVLVSLGVLKLVSPYQAALSTLDTARGLGSGTSLEFASAVTFIKSVASVEVALGLALLPPFTRRVAYFATATWIALLVAVTIVRACLGVSGPCGCFGGLTFLDSWPVQWGILMGMQVLPIIALRQRPERPQ